MEHVMTVGHDGPAAAAAIDRLWHAGYRSIVRADDLAEARQVARSMRPRLAMVLPDAARAYSAHALGEMAAAACAPVIVAHRDIGHAFTCLGPWLEDDDAAAVRAMAERPLLAA